MIENSSFDYELRKSDRSRLYKPHRRQKRFMRSSDKQKSLIKIFHSLENECDNDFQNCVIYSLNKNKRWKLLENIGSDLLKDFQDINNGSEIIIIERVFDGLCGSEWTKSIHAFQDHLTYSRVKKIHLSSPQYISENRGSRGTKVVNITASPEIISYNIFETPKNYGKLYENEMAETWCTGELNYPEKIKWKFNTKNALREFHSTNMNFSNDFEYQLQKAGTSSMFQGTKKPHRRMKQFIKNYGNTTGLIKLVHNEDVYQKTRDDFEPFVVYSLNRKNRWKLSTEMSPKTLENLQENNVIVVVIERQFSGIYGAMCASYVHTYLNHINMSKVKSIYQLNPEFSVKSSRGKGRKMAEVEGFPDVSYNIVTLPDNYEKLYANKVQSTCTHQHQSRKYYKLFKDEVRDIMENGDYNNIEHENFEDDSENTYGLQEKFYNLMEYVVSKPARKNLRKYYGFIIV